MLSLYVIMLTFLSNSKQLIRHCTRLSWGTTHYKRACVRFVWKLFCFFICLSINLLLFFQPLWTLSHCKRDVTMDKFERDPSFHQGHAQQQGECSHRIPPFSPSANIHGSPLQAFWFQHTILRYGMSVRLSCLSHVNEKLGTQRLIYLGKLRSNAQINENLGGPKLKKMSFIWTLPLSNEYYNFNTSICVYNIWL